MIKTCLYHVTKALFHPRVASYLLPVGRSKWAKNPILPW